MNLFDAVNGRIERRLLVNLRIDPEAVIPLLPATLRPLLVDGWAIAGMCLIRLAALRPAFMPAAIGLTTENVAHRIAVEWDDHGERRTGVWIPHRLTSSRFTVWAGGKLFPAVHSYADFEVDDQGDRISIAVRGADGLHIAVSCQSADDVPASSVFASMAKADEFFRTGSTGVSPGGPDGRCDLVDLNVAGWNLTPLAITDARSSILEALAPIGDRAQWDSAFIMRDMACQWTAAEHSAVSTIDAIAAR